MKLVQEIIPENGSIPRRYLLLAGVTDDDARILKLCNMEHKPKLDIIEIGGNGHGHRYEAWMVKEEK